MAMLDLLQSVLNRVGNIAFVVFILLIGYQISVYFYNVFFHPLRKFPGPITHAASCIPMVRKRTTGEEVRHIIELHAKYGEVVRTSPDELCFSSAAAWKDIYGHKKAGQPALTKTAKYYQHPGNSEEFDIITANDFHHSRIRRIFSNSFSDKSLKLQEPMFLVYMNKLVDRMRQVVKQDPEHKFNMVNMYNFTTFDVMGDLTFGEPLGMLDNTEYHPWVSSMFASFHFGAYLHSIRYYPFLENLLLKLVPPSLEKKRGMHREFSQARVDRRLAKKDPRPDIWGLVLARDEETGLSLQEMYSNASLFMLAGTETTATLLSGLTYHLLKNPDKLKILTEEIRTAFDKMEDITIEKLQALKYLQACVEEGLRMYPPVSNGLFRTVPHQGTTVDGKRIPGGAMVSVPQLAVYRNPNNFRDPYSFIPERWISPEFDSDKKHALQPFSLGPRNCLGKNMAYHEMRLILATVLWNFDLKLCTESERWADQKIYIMWNKKPLICQAIPVNRAS